MSEKKVVVAFDFDGTLTCRDTLLEFMKFSKGPTAFYRAFLLFSPFLLLYKAGLYPNWKIKEKIFSYLYKGMSIKTFDAHCEAFFEGKGRALIRPKAWRAGREHLRAGHETLILTASVVNWVRPFGRALGIGRVEGTLIEVSDGVITGRFLSPNCYGAEKVARLRALFPDRGCYYLTAYGDSRGDRELLRYADEGHLRSFE